MMRTKPRYIFCWWCSRQLWGKRSQVRMQRSESADEATVTVHRACADQMMRDGEWQAVEEAA